MHEPEDSTVGEHHLAEIAHLAHAASLNHEVFGRWRGENGP